jgi:hypothetical protein
MLYLICTVFGVVLGAVMVFVLLERRRSVVQMDRSEANNARLAAEELRNTAVRQSEMILKEREKLAAEAIALKAFHTKEQERITAEAKALSLDYAQERERLESETRAIAAERQKLDEAKVSRETLVAESHLLKKDLANLDTVVRKLELDRELQAVDQVRLDTRSKEMAEEYLSMVEKQVAEKINANNYAACKQKIQRAVEWCREVGFPIGPEQEGALLAQLKADFEVEVRREIEREEQARIKAQIREEEKLARELERERLAAERERLAIEEALKRALAETSQSHTAEIASLQARLAEAEALVQRRTISQAQLTKAGHIYVISNIGSFGEQIFKIGMTRRLDPKDRICELGDASVPFPFDVHMMISCPDAPALENKLHRHFHKRRINRVNPRKEFFKLDVNEIVDFVQLHHGKVEYVVDAEALEYKQSLTVSEQDQEYIEQVFDRASGAISQAE